MYDVKMMVEKESFDGMYLFTVGDEGAVRSTCRFGDEDEDEEEKEEERWKFGSQE